MDGQPTAIGNAGPFTLILDRPVDGGGGGLGFNGGQLLYLAVAGCISNDLFREARAEGVELSHVRVKVRGEFSGDPAVSDEIEYEVEIDGQASADRLKGLVRRSTASLRFRTRFAAERGFGSPRLVSDASPKNSRALNSLLGNGVVASRGRCLSSWIAMTSPE